ncbi:MAG: response regulator transcription factor [Chloroflexota bacterium]|nr:response regulator transcription factor [Chloroflexota bacterium]
MARERILVIEDDQAVARAIRFSLEGYGFDVDSAATGLDGHAALRCSAPSIVLLDLGLPDMDGLDLCSQIRAQSSVPIIILTAWGAEHEKIIALEGGADDYITKPFGMGELLARIRVALRHAAQASPSSELRSISVGDLAIDLAAHQVRVCDRPVHFTPTEFKLLETLAKNAGRMSTHQMLLREVWGAGYGADTQLLRLFISQVRAKVEQDPTEPIYIITEPGVGYRFALTDER